MTNVEFFVICSLARKKSSIRNYNENNEVNQYTLLTLILININPTVKARIKNNVTFWKVSSYYVLPNAPSLHCHSHSTISIKI